MASVVGVSGGPDVHNIRMLNRMFWMFWPAGSLPSHKNMYISGRVTSMILGYVTDGVGCGNFNET